MKHSAKLGARLLAKHHHHHRNDGESTFPAKTTDAHKFWKHTGVCPECLRRAISAGRCIKCGHTPGGPRVAFSEISEAYNKALEEAEE